MRDVVEDVEAGDSLRLQELRRVRLGLLQDRCEHVARPDLVLASALHVQDGGLQRPAEPERLRWLTRTLSPAERFERAEELVQRPSQRWEIGAARGEGPLALWVVGQRIEQVL